MNLKLKYFLLNLKFYGFSCDDSEKTISEQINLLIIIQINLQIGIISSSVTSIIINNVVLYLVIIVVVVFSNKTDCKKLITFIKGSLIQIIIIIINDDDINSTVDTCTND